MWTRRRVAIGWIALAVWVVAVVVWATRPATDHVPTGVVDGQHTSIVVECAAPLDGSAGPAGTIPPIELPRALEHIPCEAQHRSNQTSLVIDALVAVVAAAVLANATRRLRHRDDGAPRSPEPVAA